MSKSNRNIEKVAIILDSTFKWINRFSTAICIIVPIVLIIVLYVFFNFGKWSLKNKATNIEITNSYFSKAIDEQNQLDYLNAEMDYQKAIDDLAKLNGNDDLEVALAKRYLGALYLEMGKYKESYDLLNDAYVTFKNKLGEKDGVTIVSKCEIAVYDIKTNNIEQGFRDLQKLYDDATYYAHKLAICRLTAQCYAQLGNYDQAYNCYNTIKDLYAQFPVNDSERLAFANDFGCLLYDAGQYQEGLNCFLVATDFVNENKIKEDYEIITLYLNTAHGYAILEDNVNAMTWINKSIDACNTIYPNQCAYTAMAYQKMAGIYASMGDSEKQLTALEKSLDIARDTIGENHSITASIYISIGDYYQQNNDFHNSLKLHEQALEIQKNILGAKNGNAIVNYLTVAEDYYYLNQLEKSKEYIDQAEEICNDVFDKNNPNAIDVFVMQARVYCKLDKAEISKNYLEKTLKICERYYSGYNPLYANTLHNIADVFRDLGNDEQYNKCETKAKEITNALKGFDYES